MKKIFKILNINKLSKKIYNKNNNIKVDKHSTSGVIYIHNHFNGSIKDLLPELLNSTRVVIYQCFNKSIDDLPDNITHISFVQYAKFNQPINKLPANLIKLTFGCDSQFNSPINISNTLNNNIDIFFNKKFNNSFDSIYTYIKNLEFQERSNFDINNLNKTNLPNLHNLIFNNITIYSINNINNKNIIVDENIDDENNILITNEINHDAHINYTFLTYSFKNSKNKFYTPINTVLYK